MTHRITTVVLDKTGTVTNGKPVLTDIVVERDISEELFAQLLGSAEKKSEHPLVEAIVQGIKDKGISLLEVGEFEAIPGYGIKASISGKEVIVGTRKLMSRYEIEAGSAEIKMKQFEENGKTAMLVAVDQTYMGIVAVADTIKETSKEAIRRLKDLGLEVLGPPDTCKKRPDTC